ncbi:acetyltransferas-like protein [Plenodomus tracheiphilus IPT5]|uniref:Acetyltransferas-like protein n=1 Tax=Plenodomus tracheiphilus IPT5 TaxID=1408161 RepID=A0A6A7AR97_9PLEO|nr:acetyltransferas-like protein [Plenodomus tracheiphilus IPT5]
MHHQPPISHWIISSVTSDSIEEIVDFVNNARQQMFPELCAQLNDDVSRWVRSGHFLTARRGKKIIATIGYVPYDHRFPQLRYQGVEVVEVVRLFVLPDYRRCGLAAALFGKLKEQARELKIEFLYLHTHPFLPGAIRFWEKCGFAIVDVEKDPIWKTTHMQLRLT